MALTIGTLNAIFTSDTRGLERGFRRAEKAFDRLERKANNLGKTLNRNIGEGEQRLESLGAKARHTAQAMDSLGRGRAPIRDMNRKLQRMAGVLDPVSARSRRASNSLGIFAGAGDLLAGTLARVIKNFNRFVGKMRVISFTIGSLIGIVIALKDELAALGATAAGIFVNVQFEPIRERMQSISDTAALAEDRLNQLGDRAAEAGANFFTMGSQMADSVAALSSAGGMGFDRSLEITGSLTDAIVSLGGSSSDAGQRLEDLAESVRSGSVSMADLQEMVSFTNDPIQTLADAFGTSTEKIEGFIEAEQNLSLESLFLIAQQLDQVSQENDTLTAAFNRTLEAAGDLFETFNQQGGVIDSLIGQLDNLTGLLRSDVAEDAILYLADVANRLINDTLPGLAQAFVNNWGTILTTVKSVAGFLVGSAVGGVPGGILGAIIAGTGNTKRTLSALGDIATGVAGALGKAGLGDAFQFLGNSIAFVLEKLTDLGQLLGDFLAGPEGPEEKLAATEQKLQNLIQAREDLKETMADDSTARGRSQQDKMRIESLNERIKKLREVKETLEATIALSGGKGRKSDSPLKIEITGDTGPRGVEGVNVGTAMGVAPGFEEPGPAELAQIEGTALAGGGPADRLSPRAKALRDNFDLLIEQAERVETAGQNIGDAFASAFEDAILEGEKLSDVLNQLGKDIASVILKQGVTQPLGNEIATSAGNAFGGLLNLGNGGTNGINQIAQDLSGGFTGFAKGGVADEPSMFGEAGPEAAVPLPDGRNIPVDMKGGGGTQVNVINQSDSEPEVERRQEGDTEVVDVIIPAVKRAWASGEFDAENRKRYGVRPKPTGRS